MYKLDGEGEKERGEGNIPVRGEVPRIFSSAFLSRFRCLSFSRFLLFFFSVLYRVKARAPYPPLSRR